MSEITEIAALKCPACRIETISAYPHSTLAYLFGMGRQLDELRLCPGCGRLVDPNSKDGFVDYFEVLRRFRANLRSYRYQVRYSDDEIEGFIADVERKEASEYKRIGRLYSTQKLRMKIPLLLRAADHLKPVPLLGPLLSREEELTKERLMIVWEQKLLGWKKRKLMACSRCGARLEGPDGKFCTECGASQ